MTLNMKKRRPSTSIESEDEELGTGYDSEEAYIIDDEAGESDISIEETPVKRPPTKKRKVANGAASAAGSESEKEESLAKNLISQELEVLNAPYQQEIDGILHVLNSYDVKRITTLHGIGKVRAEQIVERSKASPFSSLEQLVHAGLGPKLIVTFVRRNIVEAVYFKKTATAPGSSIQRPLLVEI
jgi:DNA uptake protein ComE-like DNA-binding protein